MLAIVLHKSINFLLSLELFPQYVPSSATHLQQIINWSDKSVLAWKWYWPRNIENTTIGFPKYIETFPQYILCNQNLFNVNDNHLGQWSVWRAPILPPRYQWMILNFFLFFSLFILLSSSHYPEAYFLPRGTISSKEPPIQL